jgi:hypothetical protein
MSVLETIRKRAGLLVIAIGASMVIFILEDALTSGRFFFGGNENTVALINGNDRQCGKPCGHAKSEHGRGSFRQSNL